MRRLLAAAAAAPGGGTDVARIIVPRLGENLGQPVVIQNRPGANARGARVIKAAGSRGE